MTSKLADTPRIILIPGSAKGTKMTIIKDVTFLTLSAIITWVTCRTVSIIAHNLTLTVDNLVSHFAFSTDVYTAAHFTVAIGTIKHALAFIIEYIILLA
jgi:hypothetical protein